MFKKLLAMAFGIITVATLGFANPALADTISCGICHTPGSINPGATLSKAVLENNGKHSIETIVTQVTYSQKSMPAFDGRLTDVQIKEIATYVLSQADAG